MIVAITGGIGCGKSRVASYLVNLAQAQYCDTDQFCRELLFKGHAGWKSVTAKWGRRFLDKEDNIDRPLLRRIIFEESTIRRELEGMLHPLVRNHVAELKTACSSSNTLLVVEVPLLFEVGWQNDFDKVITVFTSKEECIKRVMNRDGSTADEILKIIGAQMAIEVKAQLSDYVIDNSGSWEATCGQVKDLLRSF
jgi:dephospho-CoA kinase